MGRARLPAFVVASCFTADVRLGKLTEFVFVQMRGDVADHFAFKIAQRLRQVGVDRVIKCLPHRDDETAAVKESVVRAVGVLVDFFPIDVLVLPLKDSVKGQQIFGTQHVQLAAD